MDIRIEPADLSIYRQCEEKWLTIAKPLYSLGVLEELINRIGAIRRDVSAPIGKRCAIIMCADNGVVCEGISQTDESVTGIVADNLALGRANLNIMSRNINVDVMAVDIGMKNKPVNKAVIDCNVCRGTQNMHEGPAMTEEECIKAVEYGISLVKMASEKGYDLIATGEMGIGNTTTASACASVLLELPAERVTGKGAGLSDSGLDNKIRVIKEAITLNKPDKHNPVDVLSKVGGLDIAGMTGLFLGGGIYHVPVIIDGFISSVAALLAVMINGNASDYMLPSHVSREPAGKLIMEKLGFEAIIHAGMALGEGTGAVTLIPLLDMAHNIYSANVTFDDINMEAYKKL